MFLLFVWRLAMSEFEKEIEKFATEEVDPVKASVDDFANEFLEMSKEEVEARVKSVFKSKLVKTGRKLIEELMAPCTESRAVEIDERV